MFEVAPTWPSLIACLLRGDDLSAEQAQWAMEEILAGRAGDARIAAFAVALRAKGESAAEVAALSRIMMARAERISLTGSVLDVVGTGGDHSGSVNISTMAALVAAACSIPVVKHGNRAASSQTGTADVLAEVGVAIDLKPAQVAECVTRVGIGFAFAPVHHPAMRHAATARRELGVPTVFNLLGPLTNPAQAQAALIGCADERLAPVMAEVLAGRGVSALVVRGDDGLDEISTVTDTSAWVASGGRVRQERIEIAGLGLVPAVAADLVGGDPARNADLMLMALGVTQVREPDEGKVQAIRDAVAVNAAGALVAWEGIDRPIEQPLTGLIAEQVPRAMGALAQGAVAALLHRWVAVSRELAAD